MKFKKIIQRGQVLALYGVLIPFLFLFVGVGRVTIAKRGGRGGFGGGL